MFNKWSKLKSYLTTSVYKEAVGYVAGIGGGTGATGGLLGVFISIGQVVWNFLTKPAVTIGLFVASGVYAHLQVQKAKKTGQEILLTQFGTGGAMPIIYGTRRVAGTVVFMNTAEFQKELFVVYAIAGHEIDSFDLETIQIDGRPVSDVQVYRDGFIASDGTTRITSSGGRGNKASGNFFGSTQTEIDNVLAGTNPPDRPRMVFNCHTGTVDQAADPLLVGCLADWTSDHKLANVAYIACNFEYDIRGQFTGIPNLSVVVNGKKLYDPRADGSITGGTGSHRANDTSTHEFSANPSLCLLDYMTNDDYGKGLDPTENTGDIDLGSFQTAANDCATTADTITHSSVVVEAASTTTDILTIAQANQSDFNNFKIGSTFTVSDGVTTYINNKALIDKESRVIDDSGTDAVTILSLKFADGAVDTAITSNTTCTFTETQVRFDCNGIIDTDQTVLENTKALVANMRGIFTYSDGKFSINVEGAESSVVSLDEDDIFDTGITLSLENKESKYNKVEAEFYNAQKRYETDTTYYTGESGDNFLTEDGNEILETRIQLPFCTNQRIAYNHAKALLKRSRSQRTVTFIATPKVLKAKVGEVITISNTNLNLSNELFRITNMVINPDLNIEVTAIEYQTAVYGYVTPPDESIGIVDDPVDGQRVEAPTNLTFTGKNATTGEAAKLTWTDSTKYPSYEFRVQIVDPGGKTRYDRRVQDEYFYLDGISIDTGYTAKVSAINTLGIESATTEINVNVTTAPITTVDIGQGSIGGFSFDATKMYHGTGTFNNTNTAVYIDDSGQFSLKDKLSFDGTTLNISGNLTVENTISADKITLDGQDLSTLIGYGTSGGLSNQFKISNDATFENQFSVVQSTTNPASGGVRLIVGGVADSDGNNFKLEAPSEALDMGLQSSSGVEINVGATDTDGTGNLSLAKFNFAWSDTATQLTLTGKTRHDASVSVNRTAYNLYVDGDDTGYIQHNFNDYIAVKGGSGTTVGLLQLYEASNNGTNYIALKSPTSVSANTTFTLPSTDGSADQVLKTDGSGNLSFSSVSSLSAIASATNMADNRVLTASGSDSVNGEANLTFDGSTLVVTGDVRAVDLNLTGSIQNTTVPAEASVKINENGYNDGTTYFRDLDIFDGKGNQFVKFDGSTQRVGIGTTTPSSLLHLKSGNRDLDFILADSPSTGNVGVQLRAGASDFIGLAGGGGTGIGIVVDSNNNVGIGTTSPVAELDVRASSTPAVRVADGSGFNIRLEAFGSNAAGLVCAGGSTNMTFQTNETERMRLDSSGRLLVGKTAVGTNTVGVECRGDGLLVATRSGAVVAVINRKSSDGSAMQFRKDNTTVGSVSVTGSATTYNTSSDARLKDDIGDFDGLDIVEQLNARKFAWKADGREDIGLYAQEVQELVPNAVSQNEDGYYQMDYSKLVTILVKGMQEQQKQIEQLKKQAHPCKELHEFEAYPELINKIEALQEQINKL